MTVAKFGATPASRRAKVQQRILRACSIAVVGLVALLMMSAVVATMVGGESDRAVVNAPVALITTPIEGELQSLAVVAGQTVEAGALVARVTNPRVDRSALLNLEEKSSMDRERVRAARDKYQSDLQYISSLNEEINLLTAALKRKLEAEIAEQQSLFAEAQAASGEKKAILDRQNAMVSRGIYNIEMSRPSEYQYAAAQYRGEAARSKLDKATAQLAALEKGIYVGDDLVTIATLVQKRRDIELDAERMAIEERELSAQDATRRSLIAEERQRLDRLSKAEPVAPIAGEVVTVRAAASQHLHAGDALAGIADCDKLVVVAIFSYRQGRGLRAGSRVGIEGAAFDRGTVMAVLPKATESFDERFAVPFPLTERRELYVLIRPERGADGLAKVGVTSCSAGQWVTVTTGRTWFSFASAIWQLAADRLPGLASALGS